MEQPPAPTSLYTSQNNMTAALQIVVRRHVGQALVSAGRRVKPNPTANPDALSAWLLPHCGCPRSRFVARLAGAPVTLIR
jgi:hypothetical protein